MSGSRQRFTGGILATLLLGWLVSGLFLFTGKWWYHTLFQEPLRVSGEPWMLTAGDLTWQRSLAVVMQKPGSMALTLVVISLVYAVMVAAISLLVLWLTPSLRSFRPQARILGSSGEWVMEGDSSFGLREFARWIRYGEREK